jgi:adenine-specific DNA-methyltransferase
MSSKKTKLELTWIGKEHRPRLEPRILLEEPDKSHHAKFRVREWPQENAKNAKGSDSLRSSVANEDRAKVKDLPQEIAENSKNSDSLRSLRSFAANEVGDIFDNMLIRGDNLLGLKALEQEFAGKVKCVFIDPPYNTGSAFEHYDDGVEHSIWLSLMRERLVALKNLMSDSGTIWITIDDNEGHYLKVLCDEVFGRCNFVSTIAWMKRVSPANDAKYFSSDHDSILVFAKNKANWSPNRLPRGEQQNSYYKNSDNDPRGPWNSVTYTGNKTRVERPNLYYGIKNPYTNEIVFPPDTLTWRYGPETHEKNVAQRLLYWGKEGKSRVPRLKMFLEDAKPIVPRSVWLSSEAGSTQTAMTEQKTLSKVPFGTPKPEILLNRIIHIATNPGDLVLDSFLGSGTTAAVAHKMGRRWIGIELGEHCETHCLPRLKKVVDGEDPGGITQAVGWKGGGGFRYYRLAPSLLEKDKWGNWVVSKEYNAAMLAEAVCKLEGFSYEPSDSLYWQHGHSTERDFIYTTTANLSHDQLQELSDEVGPERSLLVVCSAFRGRKEGYPNLTVKKIPTAVLTRCEWGKDDYSLKVENLPKAPPEPGQQELF